MPSLPHQPSLRFKNTSRIFKLTPTLLVPSGTCFSVEDVFSVLQLFQPHPLPAAVSIISSFLAYLSRKTASHQYVMNYLNSVRLLYLHHGFACDVLNSFPMALTKKGLELVMGTKFRQTHPITVDLVQCMRTVLDATIPTQAALWYLFLVAFLSFLRKYNFTFHSARAFKPSKHLTRNDIKLSRNGAVLRICWSKTLQHREAFC